ncbi:unnamed protein product [Heligmosomoides polygyrus]|uniref:Methanethiol oxidase n=1 Tax=Heligmosomoides polygyrus TaxID=6339 RepID=A0A183FZT8_HELPZ|nr:unnamed protein product [Heligmosomoides polygyrus]
MVLAYEHELIKQTIEPNELHKHGVSFPHTSHCLADGNIMISTLGDEHGNHKGNFLLVNGETFETKGCWLDENTSVPFNYDFWYQPRRDVMISTEWGAPNLIKQGFNPKHVEEGHYGRSVHIFKWSTHEKIQTIDLPTPDGILPLEVSSEEFSYPHISINKVEGWMLPEMPSLITDILISMDDRFLYISNWLHGDIRQYDITDPVNPRLNGQIFLGGSLHSESSVTIQHDEELEEPPAVRYVKGKRVEGGPQMLQLSLDGKRLYVTTSLYRQWDAQFYPALEKGGAMMMLVNIDDDGGMTLDEDFLIDFGSMEGGPYLSHEMRYPGGDCTSDIWL